MYVVMVILFVSGDVRFMLWSLNFSYFMYESGRHQCEECLFGVWFAGEIRLARFVYSEAFIAPYIRVYLGGVICVGVDRFPFVLTIEVIEEWVYCGLPLF